MFPDIYLPLFFLLIPLGIFLLVFLFYSYFNIYHLLRYGVYGYPVFSVISIYIGVTLLLLMIVGYGLLPYDWNQSFSLTQFFAGTFLKGFNSSSFNTFPKL